MTKKPKSPPRERDQTAAAQTVTRDQIIARGVANLHEFGYPQCNAENILTDAIYGGFFESMLRDNLGKGADATIKPLLREVRANLAEGEA